MKPLRLALLLSIGFTAGCVDDTGAVEEATWSAPVPAMGRRLVALGSDYKSTTLSLLDDADLTRVAPSFWHSGSAVSASTTALSGDCVLGAAGADGRIAVVDRGNAVISLYDPQARSVQQVSVGTGFRANPQAWLPRAGGIAWVSRMGRNAAPTPDAADMDEGDDIVTVNIASGAIVDRLGLAAWATGAGLVAAPAGLLADGAHAWVPLQSVGADFLSQGPARILKIGGKTLQIEAVVDVPTLKNCVQVELVAAERKVVAVCPGAFSDKAEQGVHAGVAVWNADAATPTAQVLYTAAQLGNAKALGAEIACLADGDCLVIVPGDPDAHTPDGLWRIHTDGRAAALVGHSSGPFAYSGMWADLPRSRVYVGDRGAPSGDVRVWSRQGQDWSEQSAVSTNPGGLGTIDVGVY